MEKLLQRLELCLKFVSQANQIIESNDSIDELRRLVDELLVFTYDFESDLYLLSLLKDEFFEKNQDVLSRNMLLLDAKKAVRLHKLEAIIFESWMKNLSGLSESDKSNAESFAVDYTPRKFMIERWEQKGIFSFDKTTLVTAAKVILRHSCEVIDILLFNDRIIENNQAVDIKSLNDMFDPSGDECQFYTNFINEKATVEEWRRYPDTRFRVFYDFYHETTQPDWDKLNNYQTKLFNEAINRELSILESELLELPQPYKLQNASTQLSIINKFLSGEFSELDIKRLNKFIDFTRPEEVLLELDDMNRYDVYNYEKILPYDGPNGRRSPRFIAHVLLEYQKFLEHVLAEKEPLNKEVTNNKKGLASSMNKAKTRLPKPASFMLKMKPRKSSVLSKVVNELCQYDFIDMDRHKSSELTEILLCSNFSEIKNPVHFGSNTNFCCLVLKEFFDYFENMNAASIEKSGLFKTKGSEKLTQTNFNKSTSAGTKKEQELQQIRQIIRQLE